MTRFLLIVSVLGVAVFGGAAAGAVAVVISATVVRDATSVSPAVRAFRKWKESI